MRYYSMGWKDSPFKKSLYFEYSLVSLPGGMVKMVVEVLKVLQLGPDLIRGLM